MLTGIKPSGRIHLGNYLGTIRPALELARKHRAHYFIADYHALTTVQDPDTFNRRIDKLAATWLALGLNPDRAVFYRQSAIPQIFELMWVLACTSAKSLLNRAHAYKSAVKVNLFAIYRQFADRVDVARLRNQYLAGGVAYKDIKETLADLLNRKFQPARERFAALMANRKQLGKILDNGAARAREFDQRTLIAVRQAVGIDRIRPS